VAPWRLVEVYQRFITSALKMDTARFCEPLASTNQRTPRLNPKEHNQNCHCSENFKSHNISEVLAVLMEAARISETSVNYYRTNSAITQKTAIFEQSFFSVRSFYKAAFNN
jgi:hypothetical protein